MITFSIIAAVMIIIAFFFILPPLFKTDSQSTDLNINQDANLEIARERLQELKNELAEGKIEQSEFDSIKSELELNLAEALSHTQSGQNSSSHHRRLILPLMILTPVISIAIYQYTGAPITLDPEQLKTQQEMPDVETMVATLAEKMEANPEDGEGWYMLGRSYVAMSRFNEAENAFAKAYAILGDEPSLLADYADSIGRGNGSDLTGDAKALIQKSLSIDSQHPKSRWLAGMLAFQEKEFEKVIEYLEPLLLKAEPGTELHEGLKGLVNEARVQTRDIVIADNDPVQVSNSSVELTLNVSIDESLENSVSSTDTVFVFAKATQGPPIPLAVARLTVKDLPAIVTLNDSMAMRPNLKISMHQSVSLSARVSKSGDAIAAVGDYQAQPVVVETNSTNPTDLVINYQVQ